MIAKKIAAAPRARNVTKARADHARALVDYIRLPEKHSDEQGYLLEYITSHKLDQPDTERLFHIATRNFITTDMRSQRAEMIALANAATRSSNPVDHWLISWSENEFPTPDQVDETVEMFLTHLGVKAQPAIYACHGDTHNRHVHIALNRYDPVAERMVEINKGFNHRAAQQALALIVDRFGWKAQAGAHYTVERGELVLTDAGRLSEKGDHKALGAPARKFEAQTGYASAQRRAQDGLIKLFRESESWQELHARLAASGATYRPVGTNGAVIEIAGTEMKASSVDRSCTLTRLCGRFGTYEPPDQNYELTELEPQRLPEAFRADEFKAQREAWHALSEEERAHLSRRKRRKDPADQSTLRKPPPDLESWYYSQSEGYFADRWRNRHSPRPVDYLAVGAVEDLEHRGDVGEFKAFRCSDGWRYAREITSPTAFLDRGQHIQVIEQSDEAMLAALRLAVQKSGGRVRIVGSSDFQERVFQIAQANGLGAFLTNENLVQRRAAEEATRTKSEASTRPLPSLPKIERKTDADARQPRRQKLPLYQPNGPIPDGQGEFRNLADMRSLPQFGVDDGRSVFARILPSVPLSGSQTPSQDSPGQHQQAVIEPRTSSPSASGDHDVRRAGRPAEVKGQVGIPSDPSPPATEQTQTPRAAPPPPKKVAPTGLLAQAAQLAKEKEQGGGLSNAPVSKGPAKGAPIDPVTLKAMQDRSRNGR